MFTTKHDFNLPKGLIDQSGTVHKKGTMILANARIEINAQRDPRVKANSAYAPCLILSQVITKLGNLTAENGQITPDLIGSLFIADFRHLWDLYEKINQEADPTIDATCPNCSTKFKTYIGEIQ